MMHWVNDDELIVTPILVHSMVACFELTKLFTPPFNRAVLCRVSTQKVELQRKLKCYDFTYEK